MWQHWATSIYVCAEPLSSGCDSDSLHPCSRYIDCILLNLVQCNTKQFWSITFFLCPITFRSLFLRNIFFLQCTALQNSTEIWTHGCWVRSPTATIVLCLPLDMQHVLPSISSFPKLHLLYHHNGLFVIFFHSRSLFNFLKCKKIFSEIIFPVGFWLDKSLNWVVLSIGKNTFLAPPTFLFFCNVLKWNVLFHNGLSLWFVAASAAVVAVV